MNFKKSIAVLAAAAMSVSAMSAVSVSALSEGAKSIDFEDGAYDFVYMNVDAGADDSKLSVEDYNGSKKLKVDVQSCANVPKVWFDVDKIMPRDKAVTIKTIDLELTFVPKDETKALGWLGGAIGSAGGFDVSLASSGQVNPDWAATDWAIEDNNAYIEGMPAVANVTKKFLLPSSQYTDKGINPFFGVMVWAASTEYTMYVDNIVFKDGSGNVIELGVAAPAETEAASEEAPAEETVAETEAAATEAAPAETEAPATEAAPAAPAAELEGTVISDTVCTSAGAWGQALTLTTVKNENGTFDPAILTADKAVVVYYEADTAPEVVLQSWSGGAGWAKVPANETYSAPGMAVFTYDYMTAMYEADNFTETLDAFIVGDTGSALTVNKVILVDAASLGGEAAVVETEAEVVETEAAPVETVPAADNAATTPVATGNTAAASIAVVMVAAGAAAVISKRK